MPDQPTRPILNGRYRVERAVARGGMAEVYLGLDMVLQRTVALKVLARNLSRDEGFVERFRREARAAARLNHPNIVAVYDWGEADGSYFIVMEYVAGQTLAQVLASQAPLPLERTVAIGADIAAALSAAHAMGVVHRDVKPGNVLLDSAGAVKVTDFGIARAAQASAETPLTQTGAMLGTAAYVSPEQAEGRQADERSDLYALGVVLYEMATGRVPFQGDTAVSVVYQHARSEPTPPRDLNPAVPPWLEGIILRALAKDPDQRYASAQDLRADLLNGTAHSPASTVPMAVLVGDTVVAARPPERTDTTTPGNRRKALIVAAVVLAAAIAVGAVLLATHSSTPPTVGDTTTSTTAPPPSTSSTTTTTSSTTTTLPTSFAGYAVVAGSGTGALFCPSGVALGAAGQSGPAGSGAAGTTGGGLGGAGGCGSNGGSGGHGGKTAPSGAGGPAGNGGDGGCPPATLAQMRAGAHPCDGTGSDGGNGGNGGDGAPGENGGSGGGGGNGGNTQMAKGGNGGNGGNATPMAAGSPGGAGESGGGATGTTAGVNGQNGVNGQSAGKSAGPQ